MNVAIWEVFTGIGADVFNYFFTIVSVFGFIALNLTLIMRVISRS